MNNTTLSISQRKASLIAGIALLLMAIIAPIANFKLIYGLVSTNDPFKTAANIVASENMFRYGIFLLLFVAILDIIVAWGLNIVFKSVNKNLAQLSAWLRIAYAIILISALSNLMNVLHLLSGVDYLKPLIPVQLNAQIMVLINSFGSEWNLGLVLFSLHLFLVGYLVFKSGFYPKFLGVLIVIAAIGYLVDSIGKIIISNYSLTISSYTFVGEVLLIFWLLFKKIQDSGCQISDGISAL